MLIGEVRIRLKRESELETLLTCVAEGVLRRDKWVDAARGGWVDAAKRASVEIGSLGSRPCHLPLRATIVEALLAKAGPHDVVATWLVDFFHVDMNHHRAKLAEKEKIGTVLKWIADYEPGIKKPAIPDFYPDCCSWNSLACAETATMLLRGMHEIRGISSVLKSCCLPLNEDVESFFVVAAVVPGWSKAVEAFRLVGQPTLRM